jgi:hypothetical protein
LGVRRVITETQKAAQNQQAVYGRTLNPCRDAAEIIETGNTGFTLDFWEVLLNSIVRNIKKKGLTAPWIFVKFPLKLTNTIKNKMLYLDVLFLPKRNLGRNQAKR